MVSKEALRLFAIKRTFGDKNSNFLGVETPSQLRFVNYFDKIINQYNKNMPKSKSLELDKIILHSSEKSINNFF